MGSILWLYQIQGLFIICAPDTDVTKFSYSRRTLKWIKKYGTLESFNLVKVCCGANLYFSITKS